jgi:hypothetical protein
MWKDSWKTRENIIYCPGTGRYTGTGSGLNCFSESMIRQESMQPLLLQGEKKAA